MILSLQKIGDFYIDHLEITIPNGYFHSLEANIPKQSKKREKFF